MLKNIIIMAALLGLALAASGAWAQQGGGSGSGGYISGGLGAWQNPDIGFVYDLKFDYHNADRNWTTRGFELATAELSLGSEIDHFGRMDFNARFMSDGAEIHELFFTMPSLPLGLKARGGQFLATFGRWSRFHTHFMPFISEPRIMHEYLGGHFMPQGLELSWLAPTDHYIEVFGGVFDGINGHSHDTDPTCSCAGYGPDNPPPGCHYHGDELHCPGDEEAEAYWRALLDDPDAPTEPGTNRELGDLAFMGRVQTSFEAGLDWSMDVGASLVHQNTYRVSQRFDGVDYAKTTGGVDVTVFWNPATRNAYRGLDFGVEYLRNQQEYEVLGEADGQEVWLKRQLSRDGFFTWARFRVNRTWEVGSYFEKFAAAQGADDDRTRTAGFLTYNISHYQRLRLEYVHDDRGGFEDSVDQVIIQFDGIIGYHTHGRQR